MKGDNKLTRILLLAALVFCLLILTKYILFKKSPGYYRHYFVHEFKSYKVSDGWKHANLQPFFTIRLFSSKRVSSEYSYKNIGGNIIGFIPLGILLPILFPFFKSFPRVAGATFLLSLAFEMTQLLTGIGVFDVDDLILNTTGGMAGYLIYAVSRWLILRVSRD